MNGNTGEHRPPASAGIAVSFRTAIPRRVAPQQSPPPLRRPRQCTSVDYSGTINTDQPVLIFLSHSWGAVQHLVLRKRSLTAKVRRENNRQFGCSDAFL